MIKQISIFTENKKGSMREITGILAEQGISILALVTNDSAEFGIVRMVVSNQELAYDALKKAGYMVHADTVIAVRIGDEPGSLDQLLLELLDSNVKDKNSGWKFSGDDPFHNAVYHNNNFQKAKSISGSFQVNCHFHFIGLFNKLLHIEPSHNVERSLHYYTAARIRKCHELITFLRLAAIEKTLPEERLHDGWVLECINSIITIK